MRWSGEVIKAVMGQSDSVMSELRRNVLSVMVFQVTHLKNKDSKLAGKFIKSNFPDDRNNQLIYKHLKYLPN